MTVVWPFLATAKCPRLGSEPKQEGKASFNQANRRCLRQATNLRPLESGLVESTNLISQRYTVYKLVCAVWIIDHVGLRNYYAVPALLVQFACERNSYDSVAAIEFGSRYHNPRSSFVLFRAYGMLGPDLNPIDLTLFNIHYRGIRPLDPAWNRLEVPDPLRPNRSAQS